MRPSPRVPAPSASSVLRLPRASRRALAATAALALAACGPGLSATASRRAEGPPASKARPRGLEAVPYAELPAAIPGVPRAAEAPAFGQPVRVVAARSGLTVLADAEGRLALLGATSHAALALPPAASKGALSIVVVPRASAGASAVCVPTSSALECLVGPKGAALDDVLLAHGPAERARRVGFEAPATMAPAAWFAADLEGTPALCVSPADGAREAREGAAAPGPDVACFTIAYGPEDVPRLEPTRARLAPAPRGAVRGVVARSGASFAAEWAAAEHAALHGAVQLDAFAAGDDPYGASAWRVGRAPAGEPLRHGCAVAPDGAVRCYGTNAYGQLGTGEASWGVSAGAVAGLTAVEVAVGTAHTCARTRDGHVACWGDAGLGGFQVPPGTKVDRLELCARDRRASLGLLEGGREAVVFDHSSPCEEPQGARAEDGTFRLLDEGPRARVVARPAIVPDLADVVSIAAAGRRTWALRKDGRVVSWGGT